LQSIRSTKTVRSPSKFFVLRKKIMGPSYYQVKKDAEIVFFAQRGYTQACALQISRSDPSSVYGWRSRGAEPQLAI